MVMSDQLQSYADRARSAVEKGSSPSDAVADAVKGVGLGSEKISRVCTMLNRSLLEGDKSNAYKKSSGQLWQTRWPTAKPEAVYEILGMSANDTTVQPVRKASAARQKASAAMSLPAQLDTLIPRRTPLPLDGIKTSSARKPEHVLEHEDAEVDLNNRLTVHDHLRQMAQAVKTSAVKVTEAEFAAEQARVDLDVQIDRTVKNSGLTLGEVLFAVKQSCGESPAFDLAFAGALTRHGIDPHVLGGEAFTPDGSIDYKRVKQSQDRLLVRTEEVVDALTGMVLLDPRSGLTKASTAWLHAHAHLEATRQAQVDLTAKHQHWVDLAHQVLGQEG